MEHDDEILKDATEAEMTRLIPRYRTRQHIPDWFRPYRELWINVLVTAINDLAFTGKQSPQIREQAEYFFLDQDSALAEVCFIVDMHPGLLLEALIQHGMLDHNINSRKQALERLGRQLENKIE